MKIRSTYTGMGLFLVILALLLALNTQDKKSFFNPDEIFYFKSSQSIHSFSDAVAPKYHDEHRFQKPPLFYVIISLSYKIFGVNWFSARLPSCISGILLLLATFLFGKKIFGKETALWATVFLGTSALFFRFGRISLPEMTLVLFMSSSLFLGYLALTENKRRLVYLSYLLMACATLVKGPIGFTLPLLVLIVFYRITPEPRGHVDLPWKKGALIIAAALLLWIVPPFMMFGKEFGRHLVGIELLDRVIAKTGSSGTLSAAWFYLCKLLFYIPVTWIEYLPWSLFLPIMFLAFSKDLKNNTDNHAGKFLLVWIWTGFLFFSLLPAKRNHYVLSFFPAISLYSAYRLPFRDASRKALVLISSIVVLSYMATVSFLVPFIFNDGVDRLAEETSSLLADSRDIPVAVSWRLDPQEIELYLDKPVEIIWEGTFTEWHLADEVLTEFLPGPLRKDPVFYFILAKKEYNEYLAGFLSFLEKYSGRKMTYTCVDSDTRWRKSIDIKTLFQGLFNGSGRSTVFLKRIFKEKVYLLKVYRQ